MLPTIIKPTIGNYVSLLCAGTIGTLLVMSVVRYPYLALVMYMDARCGNRTKPTTTTVPFPPNPDWMGRLPQHTHSTPLNRLAIPGSHDSGAIHPNSQALLSPLAPHTMQHYRPVWRWVKSVVTSWDYTQSLDIPQQLQLGIRYFDIRVCHNHSNGDFVFTHATLYGSVIRAMEDIRRFLQLHPKEIVLLHFNHFCNFNDRSHRLIIGHMHRIFGSLLCPKMDVRNMTLGNLWREGFRVVLFYSKDYSSFYGDIWPTQSVSMDWAETPYEVDLVTFLDSHVSYDSFRLFHANQGILTPDKTYILSNMCHGLRNLAVIANRAFVSWIRTKNKEKRPVAICLADFVELFNFVPTVIEMNYR